MVTKDELETPRTAAEMLQWVYSTLERFDTRELRIAAREGKCFAKELTDEALPIALFAQRYYQSSPDVLITHTIGNQQYDAVVEDRRAAPSAVRYIEYTVSDRDHTESLRMEILNRDGNVAAYGKVRAEGAKGRRTLLEAESMAVDHDDIREQHMAAVLEAVRRKSEKKYPDHTALIVRIDDYTPFREDADVIALDVLARQQLVPLVSGREFRVLALEGSRAVHLAYEL